MGRIPQGEWDRRAAAIGMRWLEPVGDTTKHVMAECLVCGYRVMKTPSTVNQGRGCRKCGNKRSGRRGQRISQVEWDRRIAAVGMRWLEPVKTSKTPTLAECLKCGHQTKKMCDAVTSGRGCRKCAARERGEAQLVTQAEWDRRIAAVGMRWLEPVRGANTKTLAECLTCGARTKKQGGNVQQGVGCAACAGRLQITQAEWDERIAKVGMRWLEAVEDAHSSTLAECLECGYSARRRPAEVTKGKGCLACAGKVPITQEEWDRRIAAVGMKWLEPVKAAASPALAECLNCGSVYRKSPGTTQRGSGCAVCRGMDPEAPAAVYLLLSESLDLMKVGVTNQRENSERLKTHRERGWQIIRVWPVRTRRQAFEIESAVIGYWESAGAEFAEPADVPQGDGYTETITLGRVDVPDTIRLVDELASAPRNRRNLRVNSESSN